AITFKEIPKVKYCPRLVSTPEATYKDWHVLTGRPLYVGEPVAAVAAESEEEAQRALEAVKVEYEVREAMFDALESMRPGKPLLHETVILRDAEVEVENNVACRLEITEGDVERGFAESDVVVEREYRTNRRYHNQLETKSVVVRPEPGGGITLWSTTQTIHNTRLLLHQIFGIPMNRIRVNKVSLGGSFGSSIHVNPVVPIAVALALKARRPVKLAYTREEDMHDHASYQMIFRLKLGAKGDGRLTAGELNAVLDIGAHQIQAYPLLGCVVGWWVSLYKLPHMRYVGEAVYTNKVPSCAFRGYGNPQISWALESLMDELAEALGMDPLELKLKNYVGEGDVFWGQGPTVKSVIRSCGVEEILLKGSEIVGWESRPKPGEHGGRYRRGIGLGRGFHTSSAGAPVPGTVVDYTGAILKVNEDGTLDYITAMMDQGGGSLEANAKIIAEELGVPLDNVNIVEADTQTTVYDVCTHASRGVFAGGGVAQKVAKQVKQRLLEFAAKVLDSYPHALRIRPDEELNQGVIYVEGIEGKEVTVGEVASIARHKNWGTIAAVDSLRPTSCPPHFTGYFVEVEVDTETGRVRPLRVVVGADMGTVINPALAAGQIHGGFAMGWSMATLEDTPYDAETGDLANRGFITDYKTPLPPDMPRLDDFVVFFADTYEPTGPFGAKGIGEGALNPVAGAVANAIYNAIGIRFYELPITPSRILRALREMGGG
ncbi:MAG: xanthine dehydrogenase family protein molybdopterin-binding subunit, partial [Candidatus Bathyarchaeia archaeon]